MRLGKLRDGLPRPSSPGQLMLVGLVLVVTAWLLRSFRLPFWQPVAAVALVLFLLALITSFGRPTMTQRQVLWRGRVVGERRFSWWERFYRWLYRQ